MQLGFFSLPDFSAINWTGILKTAAPAALQLAQVKQNIDTQKAVQNLQAQQQAMQLQAMAQQAAQQQAMQAGVLVPSGVSRVPSPSITRGGGRERPWVLPAALVASAVGVAVLFQLSNRSKK